MSTLRSFRGGRRGRVRVFGVLESGEASLSLPQHRADHTRNSVSFLVLKRGSFPRPEFLALFVVLATGKASLSLPRVHWAQHNFVIIIVYAKSA